MSDGRGVKAEEERKVGSYHLESERTIELRQPPLLHLAESSLARTNLRERYLLALHSRYLLAVFKFSSLGFQGNCHWLPNPARTTFDERGANQRDAYSAGSLISASAVYLHFFMLASCLLCYSVLHVNLPTRFREFCLAGRNSLRIRCNCYRTLFSPHHGTSYNH